MLLKRVQQHPPITSYSQCHSPFPAIQPYLPTYYHSHQQFFYLLQPFSQLRLCQGSNKQGSFMRNSVAFYLSLAPRRIWTTITVATITDFLLLRLRHFVYFKQQSLRIDNCDINGNIHSTLTHVLYPAITSHAPVPYTEKRIT